ncbi:30S ribosomal protein S17 [Wolbachia endosymbiont of Onchocerca ochengi]|nr:30S ribosomal protein S17 [Wolbachia endosymbiont of Onchocerca ochengi]
MQPVFPNTSRLRIILSMNNTKSNVNYSINILSKNINYNFVFRHGYDDWSQVFLPSYK